MNDQIIEYLNFLTEHYSFIENDIEKCKKRWFPRKPQTMFLFSRVGESIIKNLDLLNENEKMILFNHIENGVRSESNSLSTIVATGLVESLVTATDDNDDLWRELETLLGAESLNHALAWKNFGQ
jgi:hypothetical protein